MRGKGRAWIIALTVCVGATLWEIPNMQRIYSLHQISKGNIAAPLAEDIVATDPEAADMIRCCLNDPNRDALAELTTKYPENEFFLARLAEKLADTNCIDPQIPLALAERLAALAPENAHYRYLKGWILLKGPGDAGHLQQALDQFIAGNTLTEFRMPSSAYLARIQSLYDRAGFNVLERAQIHFGDGQVYFELRQALQGCIHTASAASDEPVLAQIAVELTHVANRVIDSFDRADLLQNGAILLTAAGGAKHRLNDRKPAEAMESRLRVAQSLAILKYIGQRSDEVLTLALSLIGVGLAALAPLLFLVQLPIAWLFMIIVNAVRGGDRQTRTGVKTYILFAIGLAIYLALLVAVAWLCQSVFESSIPAFISIGIGSIVGVLLWLLPGLRPIDHSLYRRARRRMALICGALWGLGIAVFAVVLTVNASLRDMVSWRSLAEDGTLWTLLWIAIWLVATYRDKLFRIIPYNRVFRLRIVQMLLLSLIIAGVLSLIRSARIPSFVLGSAGALLIALTATHITERRVIAADALRHFLAKSGPIVATRTKALRVVSAMIVVCWLGILVALHVAAGKIQKVETIVSGSPQAYGPVPEANRQTYERVTLQGRPLESYEMESPSQDTPRYFKLIAPEDMAPFIAARKAAGNPIDDEMLLMWSGGLPDTRTLLMESLQDPNALEALQVRAEWGDPAARQPLADLFEAEAEKLAGAATLTETEQIVMADIESMRQYFDDVGFSGLTDAELAAAMAEPNELDPLAGLFSLTRAIASVLSEDEALNLYDRVEKAFDTDIPYYVGFSSRTETYKSLDDPEAICLLAHTGHEITLTSSQATETPEVIGRLLAEAAQGDEVARQTLGEIIEAELETVTKVKSRDRLMRTALDSGLDIAASLAHVSTAAETEERFLALMPTLAELWRQHETRVAAADPAAQAFGLRSFDRDGPATDFYIAMRDVPAPPAASVFGHFIDQTDLSVLFDDDFFLETLRRACNRRIAEEVVEIVAAAAPARDVLDIPEQGGVFSVYDVFPSHREDTSHTYLEAVFVRLTTESIPQLFRHLDSTNPQLRAFIVWRLTTLGHTWTAEQISTLLADPYWKVRLNILPACNPDVLQTAASNDNATVRAAALILTAANAK